MSYGILTDRSILAAVTQGDIEIDPFDPASLRPERRNERGQLQPASYDLTLGDGVAVYDRWVATDLEDRHRRDYGLNDGSRLSPLDGVVNVLDIRDEPRVTRYTIGDAGWVLLPGIGYLLHTRERVHTRKYIPVLDGKSSLARLFLSVHSTAGYGDAGFDGQYTLEVTVAHPLRIYAGPRMKIAQMRFHTMAGTLLRPYDGNYKGETARGAVPSRAWRMFR